MNINYKGTMTKIMNEGIFIYNDLNTEKLLLIKDGILFMIKFSNFEDEQPNSIETVLEKMGDDTYNRANLEIISKTDILIGKSATDLAEEYLN